MMNTKLPILTFLGLSLNMLLGPTPALSEQSASVDVFLFGINPQTQISSHSGEIVRLKESMRNALAQKNWRIKNSKSFRLNEQTKRNDAQRAMLFQSQIKKATQTYENGSLDEALPFYIEAINSLASLDRPSIEQTQKLASLRLQTANKLLATDDLDKTANKLLRDALKAHPLLELNAAQYPPRLRKRFAQIRAKWAKDKKNDFLIRSTPSEAIVYLEGQRLGLTPLHLLNHIGKGKYRLWLEKNDIQTPTRWIEVAENKVEENFNFQVQYFLNETQEIFEISPNNVVLFDFLEELQKKATQTPIILTGILSDGASWDIFTIWVDPHHRTFIKTNVNSLEQTTLLSVSELHVSQLIQKQWAPLEPINFFNPATSNETRNINNHWETWGLLSLSAFILSAAITATVLFWPNTEEEGHLEVSVVP